MSLVWLLGAAGVPLVGGLGVAGGLAAGPAHGAGGLGWAVEVVHLRVHEGPGGAPGRPCWQPGGLGVVLEG